MVTEKHKKELVEKGNKALENSLWEEGVSAFKELDEIFPDNIGVLTNLSICFLNSNHFEDCHEILNKLDELTPLSLEVNYRRGNCFEKEKKYDDALKSFKKCLKIDKEHINSWHKCAIILRITKNFSDAIGLYKHILTIQQSYEVLIELAITLHLNKQNNEAIHILESMPNENKHSKKIEELLSIFKETI